MDDDRLFRWRFPKGFREYYITTPTDLAFNPSDAIDDFDEPGIGDEWFVRQWLWQLVGDVFHRSRLCDILNNEVRVGPDFGYSDREIVHVMARMIIGRRLLLHRAEPLFGQVAPAPLYTKEEAEAGASAARVRATSFIEIAIVDTDNRPVVGQSFELELADGRKVRAKTNREGMLRLENVPEGTCAFTLSEYDADAWGLAK